MPLHQLYFSNSSTNAICELNYHLTDAGVFDVTQSVYLIFGPMRVSLGANLTKIARPVVRTFIPFCQAFPAFNLLNQTDRNQLLTLIEVLDVYFKKLDSKLIRLQVVWNLLHALNTNGNNLIYQSPELFKQQVAQYSQLLEALLSAEQLLNNRSGMFAINYSWLDNNFIPAVKNTFHRSLLGRPEAGAIDTISTVTNYGKNLLQKIISKADEKLVMPLLDVQSIEFTTSKRSEIVGESIKDFSGSDMFLVGPYVTFAVEGFYGVKPGQQLGAFKYERQVLQISVQGKRENPNPKWAKEYLKEKYFSDPANVEKKLSSFSEIITASKRIMPAIKHTTYEQARPAASASAAAREAISSGVDEALVRAMETSQVHVAPDSDEELV